VTPGYESRYLRAVDPERPRAVWLRHTTLGGVPAVWVTLFDEHAVHATKRRPDGDAFAADGVRGPGYELSWAALDDQPLRHLPAEWMYRAPLPKTKLESPLPRIAASGSVTVDGTTFELDGWPGMVGHNWGAEHAERWIWLHGSNFEGHGEDTWLDAAIGRIKVGPWTTPWIANGVMSLDGKRIPIGGIEKVRATRIDEQPDRAAFTLPSGQGSINGEVQAPRERFVGWIYADPDGSEHNTVNCSLAELTLDLGGKRLHTPHGAAYELGMRENDHRIPIQPFPDG
jgi:hypothetical protein